MFQDLPEVLVPAVVNRLVPETFDLICRTAIKTDIQTLRAKCLKFAEQSSNGIRKLYDSHELSPAVQTELVGIWEPAKHV